LYVPKESVSKYQTAEVWKNFSTIIGRDSEDGEVWPFKRYYLRNKATGKFWGAANNWGTQASLVDEYQYVTFDESWHMKTIVSNGGSSYYFNGGYMDGPQSAAIQLAIETGPNNTYLIHGYDEETDNEVYYGYDGSTTVLGKLTNKNDANAQWEILTEEDVQREQQERLAQAAASDTPVDVSFVIRNADFGRNRTDEAWTISKGNGNVTIGGPKGYSLSNYCTEFYWTTYTLSQKIENLPNGFYRVTMQGFYREGGDGPSVCEELRQSNSEHLYAMLFANIESKPLMSIFDEAGKNGEVGKSTSFGYVPNTMQDACSYFSAGLYTQSVDVKVTDGTLIFGVKKDEAVSRDWTAIDHFTLTFLSDSNNDNPDNPDNPGEDPGEDPGENPGEDPEDEEMVQVKDITKLIEKYLYQRSGNPKPAVRRRSASSPSSSVQTVQPQ